MRNVLIALFIVPVIGWVFPHGSSPSQPFAANAQTRIRDCGRIFAYMCKEYLTSQFDPPVLVNPQLELLNGATNEEMYAIRDYDDDVLKRWLKLREIPETGADIVFGLGREDLKGDLRAFVLNDLVRIYDTPDSQRTNNERLVLQWFHGEIRRQEITLYNLAVEDAQSYINDPCHWKPDPVVASQYGLNYNGAPYCNTNPLIALFTFTRNGPQYNYLYAAAMKKTYGDLSQDPDRSAAFIAMANATALKFRQVQTVAAIREGSTAGIAGVAAGVATGLAIGYTAQSIFPSAGMLAASLLAEQGIVAPIVVNNLVASATGPAFIVGIMVSIGVQAGLAYQKEEEFQNSVNVLRSQAGAAGGTDLRQFLSNSEGMYKALLLLTLDTPMFPSTAPLPTYRPGTDRLFIVKTGAAPVSQQSLEYIDFKGTRWLASMWNNWFVQHGTTSSGVPIDSISTDLDITDWDGIRWHASRNGAGRFLVTKDTLNGDETPCPPDPVTGLTLNPQPRTCASYVTNSVKMTDASGAKVEVSLGTAPKIGDTPFYFPVGAKNSYNLDVTGEPRPKLTVIGGTVPGWLHVDGGRFTVDGVPPAGTSGSFLLTLQATSVSGTDQRSIRISYGVPVTFTSSSTVEVQGGVPVTYKILTSGMPRPKLTKTGWLPSGFTFTDNGDGTGTLRGLWRGIGETVVCVCQAPCFKKKWLSKRSV